MIRHPETIGFTGSGKREERRVPHNRDSLVAAITDFELAADEMILDAAVKESLQALRPDSRNTPDPSKREAYEAAKRRFLQQERVAGRDFAQQLFLHRASIEIEAESVIYPPEPLGEEKYTAIRKTIRERTEYTLQALDTGALYSPSPPSKADT